MPMNALRVSASRCLDRSITSIPLLINPSSQFLSRRLPLPASCPSGNFQQLRHVSWFKWGKNDDESSVPKAGTVSRSLRELLKLSPKTQPAESNMVPPVFEKGSLAKTSILSQVESEASPDPSSPSTKTITTQDYLSYVDPKRAYAWSWPKRWEARQYRRRGRLTRRMRILQTEKSHTAKSHWIKTSIKKLAPLARQIAGMKLNDAIVQMRFSAKKASSDVLGHLTQARAEAMVRRDMDPEEMYVSEAWVGRGQFDMEQNHRARGRIDTLKRPWTSITVVLKEEATRKRIAAEKEAKKARQKVWVQLPNRPIYGQRQYYQW
ncbi:ribosomal protein L22/L17 [Kalaharituber pfeilii]|nr:ribosomal protein L22/L17 [Kalaharituber pfeilii]